MKYIFIVFVALHFAFLTSAQVIFDGSEFGVELVAGGSSLGGSVGGDLKYAAILNENFAVGPSFRLQRTWSNNLGQKFGFSIYGAGVFAHYRLKNVVFAGIEYEALHCPINYVNVNSSKSWLSTLFIGGGFSRDFNHKIRINAGVFYDVINADNSPFRSSYNFNIKNEAGQIVKILPIIYRISFFFPLGWKESKY
jgi:hypothetical protein